MKKTVWMLMAMAITLSACNTFEGMGEDIQNAGEGLSGTAKKTKDKINN